MSVFHLKDLHPAAAVWEASPESLVHSALPRLSSALLCAENGFCSCVADKIEEAQKELKDPKGSQKGKRSHQNLQFPENCEESSLFHF